MNLRIFEGFNTILLEVAGALFPLFILFVIFQFFFLRLPLRKLMDIGIGFILTFLGLSIFLQGVHVGFMPIGAEMGKILGSLSYSWIFDPGWIRTWLLYCLRRTRCECIDSSGRKIVRWLYSTKDIVVYAIDRCRHFCSTRDGTYYVWCILMVFCGAWVFARVHYGAVFFQNIYVDRI